jgi:hypothetical protein
MAVSLHELLQPQVILRVVSRIRPGQGRLGRWLGFQTSKYDPERVSLTGPNTVQGDTRYATFRIFDATRTVAQGRAPGTGPATIPVNPVGSVPVSCARFHMKIPLSYEELGNLSPIIGPNSVIDPGGQNYVQRMIGHIARRFNNVVELMASGMLQDNLFLNYQGDNIVATIGQLTGTNAFGFQVPFQVPAGNKSQLNMLGSGNLITVPWSNPNSLIIQQIMSIKAAFMQLSGYALTDVWVNSPTWYRVLVNTEVRNTAGSANTPFAEYDNVPERGFDGEPTGDFEAILRADPTITWHITDEVLVTNSDVDPSYGTAPSTATLTKMVPDNTAFFLTRPSPEWAQLYHGGEYVVENPGMPGVLRRGYHFWHEYVTQPSAVDLIGLLNAVPLLYVPKVIAPATVSGF